MQPAALELTWEEDSEVWEGCTTTGEDFSVRLFLEECSVEENVVVGGGLLRGVGLSFSLGENMGINIMGSSKRLDFTIV